VKHYADWGVAFQWFELSRTEFLNWLNSRHYSLPCFWGCLEKDAVPTRLRGKKGPTPGELRRYEADDLALIPEIEKIMKEENKSVTAAVRTLAEANKIKGIGSLGSRVKRVVALFRRDQVKRSPSDSC
jgi:hypothetical protein